MLGQRPLDQRWDICLGVSQRTNTIRDAQVLQELCQLICQQRTRRLALPDLGQIGTKNLGGLEVSVGAGCACVPEDSRGRYRYRDSCCFLVV